MLHLNALPLDDIKVLSEALTQFIENQPDLDPGEAEAPEVPRAQAMLDEVNAALVARLS